MPLPGGKIILPCPTNVKHGHMTCFGQWNVSSNGTSRQKFNSQCMVYIPSHETSNVPDRAYSSSSWSDYKISRTLSDSQWTYRIGEESILVGSHWNLGGHLSLEYKLLCPDWYSFAILSLVIFFFMSYSNPILGLPTVRKLFYIITLYSLHGYT